MKKIKNTFADLYSTKEELSKTLKCILMVSISTVIYCLGVMWFLEPAQLYSGGVTGISQLISNASEKWTGHRIGRKRSGLIGRPGTETGHCTGAGE